MRRLVVTAVSALMILTVPNSSVAQQQAVSLRTPYPSVAVEAGQTASFELTVEAPAGERVDLAVTEVPDGWIATLRGGGFVIDGVTVDPDDPADVRLEVEVPPAAAEGNYQVVVTAQGPSGSDELRLDLRVAEAVAGGATLTAEFPSLRGPSDATYPFSLTLANETPEEITFSLQAEGPEAWQIDVRPSGQRQAATATVPPGETTTINVDVDPVDDTQAGTYPVLVRAVGGGQTAEAELEVEITGNFSMVLRTPDERLNATVRLGGSSQVALQIINDGTAPLVGVELSSTPPSGWDVTFDPPLVEQIPPGELADVTAIISPSGEAVAGDYAVNMRASVPEASDQVELRTTVETSPLWGFVGLLLIVAALIGLGWVFRRYGRR